MGREGRDRRRAGLPGALRRCHGLPAHVAALPAPHPTCHDAAGHGDRPGSPGEPQTPRTGEWGTGVRIDEFGMHLFSLEGRNAIVTGGNSGIGRPLSVALAAAGADVLVAALEDDDGTTRRLVEAQGQRLVFLEVDIARPGMPERVVRRCLDELRVRRHPGQLRGHLPARRVEDFGRESGTAWWPSTSPPPSSSPTRRAGLMIAQGSRQDHQHRVAVLVPRRSGSPAYAATKAGIVGFTRAYCDELAEHNIQVNAIAPGYFVTAITEAMRADPDRPPHARARPRRPVGRRERPDGGGRFLASRAADYVNGHVLTVDGGYLCDDGPHRHDAPRAPAPRSSSLSSRHDRASATLDRGRHRRRRAARGERRPVQEVPARARHLRRPVPRRHRLRRAPPGRSRASSAGADAPGQRRAADRRHRHRGRSGDRRSRTRSCSTGRRWTRSSTIDPVDMMATAQCGVPLQVLEDTLRERG